MEAKTKLEDKAVSYLFSAITLLAVGWLVLEKFFFDAHARLIAHLFVSLLALGPAAIGIRRYRIHYLAFGQTDETPKQNWSKRFFQAKSAVQALVVASSGYLLVFMTLKSGFFLTGMCAIVFLYVPWARMALCRNDFLVANVLVVFGALLALLTTAPSHVPLILAYAAWVFWLCSLCALLLVLSKARQPAGQPHVQVNETKAAEAQNA